MTTRTERSIAVLLSATALAGWGLLVGHAMPYTTDSAAYVEVARSLRRGEGFLVAAYGVRPIDVDRHPLDLFPPGYPLAIAAAGAFGVTPTTAAVVWPGLAFACLPALYRRLFRRVIPPAAALVAAGLATWSAGTIVAALHAWSDVPFLMLAVASFDVLLLALARRSVPTAWAAGLVVGATCLTRNVGYALVAAHGIGLGVAAALAAAPPRFVVRAALGWLAGCVVSYGWWLARNFLLFGTLQPYEMGRSDLTVRATAVQAAHAAAAGLLGTWNPSAARVALPLVAATLAYAVAAGFRRLRAANARAADRRRAVAWATFAAYGAVGLLLVIVARARYAWGESIGERHLLQYQWIVLAGLTAAFVRLGRGRAWTRLVGAVLVAGLLFAQTRPIARQLRHARDHGLRELAAVEAFGPRIAAAVPARALVASNVAPLLRIVTDLPVRQINAAATATGLRQTVTPTRPLYLAIFPCDTFCRGLYPEDRAPAWLDGDPTTLTAAGYEIVDRMDGAVLLRAVEP